MKIEVTSTKYDVDAKEFKVVLEAAMKLSELESNIQYSRSGIQDVVIERVASVITEDILRGQISKDIMSKVDIDHIVSRIHLKIVNNFSGNR